MDPCVHSLGLDEGRLILCVYVDDMLLVSGNDNAREKAKQLVNDHFESRHIGKVSYLLGVKFSHGNDGSLTLSHQAYIQRLLQRFHLEVAKAATTPMEMRPFFPEKDEAEDTNANVPYKELIGSLLYLAQRTRPDVYSTVGKLAQYCSKFTVRHQNSAKRVLRYLKETTEIGITYQTSDRPLTAYASVSLQWRKGSTVVIQKYVYG
ncbi:hypothetical protein M514_19631 [Trichuris suis]|uniref:Reverse transcriptase Ty1/copia-type domain-containing protein n=1 Tax=Trichuris suis TaxID=68888 RepID=A0A085NFA3_9BILA|nr:hypothetical protein M514_19631 [Trichuris suis]KHJ44570.1 reverse transcriptase [Trichuris suis]